MLRHSHSKAWRDKRARLQAQMTFIEHRAVSAEEAHQKLIEIQEKKSLKKVKAPFKPHKRVKLDNKPLLHSSDDIDAILDGIAPTRTDKKRLCLSAHRKRGCHDDPDQHIDDYLRKEGLPLCHSEGCANNEGLLSSLRRAAQPLPLERDWIVQRHGTGSSFPNMKDTPPPYATTLAKQRRCHACQPLREAARLLDVERENAAARSASV